MRVPLPGISREQSVTLIMDLLRIVSFGPTGSPGEKNAPCA